MRIEVERVAICTIVKIKPRDVCVKLEGVCKLECREVQTFRVNVLTTYVSRIKLKNVAIVYS